MEEAEPEVAAGRGRHSGGGLGGFVRFALGLGQQQPRGKFQTFNQREEEYRKQCADVNGRQGELQRTALMIAALAGQVNVTPLTLNPKP